MPDPSIPICLKCGYSLQALTDSRCPECGQVFDPIYVSQFESRTPLLPWERPELGRTTKRILWTILSACLHSKRFFDQMRKRSHQTICQPTKFILACLALALAIHFLGGVLNMARAILVMTMRRGDVIRATGIAFKSLYYSLKASWYFPSLTIASSFLAVLFCAIVLYLIGRKKLAKLRWVDLSASFAPFVVANSAIYVLGLFIVGIDLQTMSWLIFPVVWGPLALLAVMVWNCCRHLLGLRRPYAIFIVLLCGAIGHYSYWPVNLVLLPLLQALVEASV